MIAAIVIITLALVFYTVGVWAERIQGTLRWWHAGAFAVGLACDITGTILMSKLANQQVASQATAALFDNIMAWTGALAVCLMAIHLCWAVIVLIRNRPIEKTRFHKLSIIVWVIWLIPYFTGAIGAMITA